MSVKYKKFLQGPLEYLESIPEMDRVLKNLPEGLRFGIKEGNGFSGAYIHTNNVLYFNKNTIRFSTPQDRLKFCCILAHELGHANQNEEGIYYDDLIDPSFSDTFRIARIMEADAYLLSAIVENSLLKRSEFQGCHPSVYGRIYQRELEGMDGKVELANTNFILSFWKNGMGRVNWTEKEFINQSYFSYIGHAYRSAISVHNPENKRLLTKIRSAKEVMDIYTQRMKIKGVPSERFLQDGFDRIHTSDNFKKGITVFNADGDKLLNIAPVEEFNAHMLSFFVDNQIVQTYLRNFQEGLMASEEIRNMIHAVVFNPWIFKIFSSEYGAPSPSKEPEKMLHNIQNDKRKVNKKPAGTPTVNLSSTSIGFDEHSSEGKNNKGKSSKKDSNKTSMSSSDERPLEIKKISEQKPLSECKQKDQKGR